MRGARFLGLGVLLFAMPAEAIDVVFEGTVEDTCTLAIPVATPGQLALSGDHTIFGSDQSGGTAVVLTLLSLGPNTITVGAPSLTQSPAGYSTAGQSLQLGYSGFSGLTPVSKAMGTGGGSFSAGFVLAATEVTIDARVVNTNGFAQGDYQITSVVTCS